MTAALRKAIEDADLAAMLLIAVKHGLLSTKLGPRSTGTPVERPPPCVRHDPA